MPRTPLTATLALLTLSFAAPIIDPTDTTGVAYAADDADKSREQKEERRVLKLSDMGTEDRSEAYRAMAREKRHESMRFLKDILSNRAPQGEQKAEML